jgi:hypothetical protein
MGLSGLQSRKLQEALLSAFPQKDSLEQMLFYELDKKLDEIAGGGNLKTIVFELIAKANAENWVTQLITGARSANSGNQLLQDIERELLSQPEPVEVNPSPVSANNPPPNISPSAETKAVEVFFSYAHEDEELRDKLNTHLKLLQRQGVIDAWHDREIAAGTEWAGQINEHLETAKVILLLISADFLASDYCYDVELKRAMERHKLGEARVIPIILRPVDWAGTSFARLQALPKDAKPVTTWENQDEAFTDVAKGIRKAVGELTGKKF